MIICDLAGVISAARANTPRIERVRADYTVMRVLFTFHDSGMVRDFLGPNMDLGKVALLPGGQQFVPGVIIKVLVIHFDCPFHCWYTVQNGATEQYDSHLGRSAGRTSMSNCAGFAWLAIHWPMASCVASTLLAR